MLPEINAPGWNLLLALDHHAREPNAKPAFCHLIPGHSQVDTVTFSDLNRMARGMSSLIENHTDRGARVLLVLPNSIDFVVAFFACLYVGRIPVPVAIPGKRSSLENLMRIAENAEATALVAEEETIRILRSRDQSVPPRLSKLVCQIGRASCRERG